MKTPSNSLELDEMITRPTDQVRDAMQRFSGPITVLGAGGKMGFHLCRMLQRALTELNRDNDLLAVSRFSSTASLNQFKDAGIATRVADLCDPVQVTSLPVTPWVFFLAGVKFGTANQPELLTQMNGAMPRLVAQHYAVVDHTCGGSTETDPTAPPGAYAQACLDRETAFTDISSSHGTKCCLIRLNYSIDLRYGVLLDIAQQVMHDVPVNIETGYVNVI